MAIMIHGQLALETEALQVGEQLALGRYRVEQRGVRSLPAAGAQQADGRRPAVGGCRIEIVEDHVHAVEQVVLAQPHFVQVAPGQRADVEDDDVEGRAAGRRREGRLQT
ncbi:hypothetical protein D3C81_1584220 [compost metagenome]